MTKQEIDKLPCVEPFNGMISWHGSFMNDDNLSTELRSSDIKKVLWSWETNPEEWDGECAAIVLMNDGRYVTWETYWGPTGNGFSEDAYGGDADIHISSTLLDALTFGLGDFNRARAIREIDGDPQKDGE